MKKEKSQSERVIGVLNQQGYITRNQCLRNYISRLGAIICALKAEGWDFRTEHREGDYAYIVIKKPEATLFSEKKWIK